MVKIDKDKCRGCGMCVSICGKIFEIGDDGKARVKFDEDVPCIKDAIRNCPFGAISE